MREAVREGEAGGAYVALVAMYAEDAQCARSTVKTAHRFRRAVLLFGKETG